MENVEILKQIKSSIEKLKTKEFGSNRIRL